MTESLFPFVPRWASRYFCKATCQITRRSDARRFDPRRKVIDPSQGLVRYREVAVKNGKIAALLDPGAEGEAGVTIDATGHLVTPGLIDLHVHVYPDVPWG